MALWPAIEAAAPPVVAVAVQKGALPAIERAQVERRCAGRGDGPPGERVDLHRGERPKGGPDH